MYRLAEHNDEFIVQKKGHVFWLDTPYSFKDESECAQKVDELNDYEVNDRRNGWV